MNDGRKFCDDRRRIERDTQEGREEKGRKKKNLIEEEDDEIRITKEN